MAMDMDRIVVCYALIMMNPKSNVAKSNICGRCKSDMVRGVNIKQDHTTIRPLRKED